MRSGLFPGSSIVPRWFALLRGALPFVVSLSACAPGDDGPLLVLWTDTRGGGALHVAVDGTPAGTLESFFSAGNPPCAPGRGVIRLRLSSGAHDVVASDAVGRRWRGSVDIDSAPCTIVRLAPPGTPRFPGVLVADSVGIGRRAHTEPAAAPVNPE